MFTKNGHLDKYFPQRITYILFRSRSLLCTFTTCNMRASVFCTRQEPGVYENSGAAGKPTKECVTLYSWLHDNLAVYCSGRNTDCRLHVVYIVFMQNETTHTNGNSAQTVQLGEFQCAVGYQNKCKAADGIKKSVRQERGALFLWLYKKSWSKSYMHHMTHRTRHEKMCKQK